MRTAIIVTLVTLLSVSAASAQEGTAAGAGRMEISAFPGGGVFFGGSRTGTEPDFANYTVGASFTWNANRWMGVEGEVGGMPSA